MSLLPIDGLAAENNEIIRKLAEERLNPSAQKELLLRLEVNNERIRRRLAIEFLKLIEMGADLQPYWELEENDD